MIKSLIIAFNRVVLGRIKCISVGPEQDGTEELESWMGASKSDSIAISAKYRVRKQRSIIDEAVSELAQKTCSKVTFYDRYGWR